MTHPYRTPWSPRPARVPLGELVGELLDAALAVVAIGVVCWVVL